MPAPETTASTAYCRTAFVSPVLKGGNVEDVFAGTDVDAVFVDADVVFDDAADVVNVVVDVEFTDDVGSGSL